jgi:hypothetical protein
MQWDVSFIGSDCTCSVYAVRGTRLVASTSTDGRDLHLVMNAEHNTNGIANKKNIFFSQLIIFMLTSEM